MRRARQARPLSLGLGIFWRAPSRARCADRSRPGDVARGVQTMQTTPRLAPPAPRANIRVGGRASGEQEEVHAKPRREGKPRRVLVRTHASVFEGFLALRASPFFASFLPSRLRVKFFSNSPRESTLTLGPLPFDSGKARGGDNGCLYRYENSQNRARCDARSGEPRAAL